MKLLDLPIVIKEAICCHEALRRMGFRSEDIFVVDNMGEIFVALKTQGKEFNIDIGTNPEKDIQPLWETATNLYNTSMDDEALELWNSSQMKQTFIALAQALKMKGIAIPKLMN